MTIREIRPETAREVLSTLEDLGRRSGALLFRGHRDAEWPIESTLNRHRAYFSSPILGHDIDEMISHFIVRLKSIDVTPPFSSNDRRARLEYARHYGVPSPLIDFSLSPYVALFFAFNGVRPRDAKKTDHAAICCLNINELALVWARNCAQRPGEGIDSKTLDEENRKFRYGRDEPFDDGYPVGILKYFDLPASWNRRMLRQLGVFLYDTLDYKRAGLKNLDEYLNQPEARSEPPTKDVMLTKVLIPHEFGREIFERLELMGITATHLYDGHEGAAADVINAYNYSRKTGYAWDIVVPPSKLP
jgi:FRG domain